jgi:hypothetical protein
MRPSKTAREDSKRWRLCSWSPPNSVRSLPALNAGGAPVRTMTETDSSCESSSNVRRSSYRRATDSALRFSGRFMVSTAMSPRRSTRSAVGSDMRR